MKYTLTPLLLALMFLGAGCTEGASLSSPFGSNVPTEENFLTPADDNGLWMINIKLAQLDPTVQAFCSLEVLGERDEWAFLFNIQENNLQKAEGVNDGSWFTFEGTRADTGNVTFASTMEDWPTKESAHQVDFKGKLLHGKASGTWVQSSGDYDCKSTWTAVPTTLDTYLNHVNSDSYTW